MEVPPEVRSPLHGGTWFRPLPKSGNHSPLPRGERLLKGDSYAWRRAEATVAGKGVGKPLITYGLHQQASAVRRRTVGGKERGVRPARRPSPLHLSSLRVARLCKGHSS